MKNDLSMLGLARAEELGLMKPNVILAFDMDGVLVSLDFTTLQRKCYDKDEWIQANMTFNPYNFVRKTTLFDEVIRKKDSEKLFLASVTHTMHESNNKIKYLKNNYPNIKEQNMYFVSDEESKIMLLRVMLAKPDKESCRIVLVEDSFSTLNKIESLNNDRLKCIHISDFI